MVPLLLVVVVAAQLPLLLPAVAATLPLVREGLGIVRVVTEVRAEGPPPAPVKILIPGCGNSELSARLSTSSAERLQHPPQP